MRIVHKEQQDAAIEPIRNCGASPAYDDHGFVERLSFDVHSSVRDEELACLSKLVHLRTLYLAGRGFTDRGLASLANLKEVEDVYVWRDDASPVLGDEGLSYLSRLESLKKLFYSHASVTDAGFRHLAGMHNLEELSISLCREATDEGLKSLANIEHLRSLLLANGPRMTGEGLAALPNPSGLERLSIGNVTDAGMRTITRFPNLRELEICIERLSVDGLKNIRAFRHLEKLHIGRALMDEETIKSVIGDLPGLKKLGIAPCPRMRDGTIIPLPP
jgi:hypothetical protein